MTDQTHEQDLGARIARALDIAASYGGMDGDDHKMWAIDQMVRALCGAPQITVSDPIADGASVVWEKMGDSDEYAAFVEEYAELGKEDDPDDVYEWSEGIAP
jgi:hypothetical protein